MKKETKHLLLTILILTFVLGSIICICYIATFTPIGPIHTKVKIEEVYPQQSYPPLELTDLECFELLTDSESKQLLEETKKGDNIDPHKQCLTIIEHSMKDSPLKVEQLPNMQKARALEKTITLNNKDVLIIGGDDSNSVELFKYKTKTFKLITDSIDPYLVKETTPSVRRSAFEEPVLMPSGNVFYQGAIFDSKTETVHSAKNSEERQYLNFFRQIYNKNWLKEQDWELQEILPNGEILVGIDCKRNTEETFECSKVCLKSPINAKQYKPAKLLNNRSGFKAFVINKDKVLIVGGYTYTNTNLHDPNFIAQIEEYNPITGDIKPVLPILDSKEHYNLDKVNNNLYLIREPIYNVQITGNKYSLIHLGNNSIEFIRALPRFSYYIALLNNEYLLFNMPNQIVGLCGLNSHKLYRTYNPNLLSFSKGFTQIDEDEVLLTGGRDVISLYDPKIYRSKFAAILSVPK